MKTIKVTFKTGITIDIYCDDYKEQENKYIFIINKNNIETIDKSPIDLLDIEGIRID